MALIEDEHGILYLLDYETGKVTAEHRFGKDKDFEDIACVDDKIYVLRSTGVIYRIKRLGSDNQNEKKYETVFSHKNDLEGLCYYKEKNSLLLVCKRADLTATHNRIAQIQKAIYEFDLTGKKMLPQPFLTIDLNKVEDDSIKMIMDKNMFQPSGIAVHPISGDFYIISSVGRILLVADKNGKISALSALPRKVFKQPEGICFTPKGDLLISNEGRRGTANILIFRY